MTKFFSYILPEYLPMVDDAIKNAIKNPNTLISIEYEAKRGDGKVACFSSMGKVVPENNKLTVYGTTTDITEKKQNEQKLLRSDRVFNLTIDMFCIAGFDGYFKYLNPAWEKTLGWRIEELLSKPWLDFVHPDDVEKTKNVKSVIVDGNEIHKFENRYFCKDGSVKWLSWNSQPFPDENIMIAAARDVTETKKIEKELIQAKEKAEASNANVTAIIEGNKNSIWAFNRNYEVLYVNQIFKQEFLHSFGVHLEKGTNLLNALPPQLRPLWKPRYDKVLKNEQFTIEDAVPTKNSTIYIEVTFNPIVKNGQVIGGSCFGSDITYRKRSELELIEAKEKAEENELKYSTIFENAPVLIDAFDSTGKCIMWNKECEKTFGWSMKELNVIKNPLELFYPDHEVRKKVLETVSSSPKKTFIEYQPYTRNGEQLSVLWANFEISSGMIINIGYNITKQKKIEQELISAKEKAEESDRLKSAFLANMSHEIRTPMNGILGFTSLLRDANLSVKNQKDYINIIEKSGNRLLNTVNDIIEISKIESGELSVTESKVDIIGHLDTLVTFFTPEAKKKNIDIILQNNFDGNNLTIITDKNKLSSILSNLIKNAIKYTDEGTIKVGLKIENNQVLFSCQDTGIGIPKSRQEAIFNRFEQADIDDKHAHQGSGLGLAIVKSYVELLNGKIWVESEESKGSTFYVSLPFKQEKKKEKIVPQKIKSSNSGMKNINVLVVEDDDISLMHLSIIVEGEVKNISTARNGIEAIDACKNDSGIDLILMDIKMPEMDGIEATKKIREFNSDVVIIAQTAYALEGDKVKALDAGCNAYISKPIKKDKLFEVINKYF